jgi:hypothetical protein
VARIAGFRNGNFIYNIILGGLRIPTNNSVKKEGKKTVYEIAVT